MGIQWMVRGLVPVHFGPSPVESSTASYPLVHLVASKGFFPGLFQSSVFFSHLCKVACGATSALHVVLNWLTFRFVGSFFWPHSQSIYLQVAATLL
jgi:hypothetical protein